MIKKMTRALVDLSNAEKLNHNDLVGYKVNVPQRGELHAAKILNDPGYVFHYLNGDAAPFLRSENFQRKFMHDLPKLLWNTEKLEDLGDFVLLFPNPAQLAKEALMTGITLVEAEEYFQEIFNTPYVYPFKKRFMSALKTAYDHAYLDLDLLGDPKDYKKKKQADKGYEEESPEGAQLGNSSPDKGETPKSDEEKLSSNSNSRIY